MGRPDFTAARWRKSNVSWDTNCVEVAFADGFIGVRDSKNPAGPVLTFTQGEWTAFLAGVKAEEFEIDDLAG
ncbi:DUF397 domain-containing protein [Couchioplanes azureus]|uniref:DUF397 domain-containing protein n=1 Tax=Couchioplanes caeruleus TaxID=56438 RepID=UPI0016712742|nr:DUF397 domain-containing protein [Couchioplanes caeruleus]GGQ79051.1 DUF397 domain-containing protein [Couchioplanes caeruleus subsp. azureus]